MKNAFIFDIDGTLIDSNDFHARSWEKAFAAHGKIIPFQKIRAQLGKGADQLLPEFLSAQEVRAIGKQVSELSGQIFKQEYMVQIRPFPKVRELFKKMRESGGRVALASSSKQEQVEQYKIIAQIDDLVEQSASADDAEASKPQPDIFHAALAQLGDPPRDTVVVTGDSPYDAIAAKRAKLASIGLLCGGFSQKELLAQGCRAIFQDPAHMLENLEQIFAM